MERKWVVDRELIVRMEAIIGSPQVLHPGTLQRQSRALRPLDRCLERSKQSLNSKVAPTGALCPVARI